VPASASTDVENVIPLSVTPVIVATIPAFE
jgi:hypothetical protein